MIKSTSRYLRVLLMPLMTLAVALAPPPPPPPPATAPAPQQATAPAAEQATASEQATAVVPERATLTATPAEAYLGDTVTLTGSGFGACTSRSAVPFRLRSDPAGIILPSVLGTGGFEVGATVSLDATPGPYTITASCVALGEPNLVSAQTGLTVLVEQVTQSTDEPSTGGEGPTDPIGNVDTPTAAGGDPQAPAIVIPPEVPVPPFGSVSARVLVLGLVVLLVLVVAGLVVHRWLFKRPPAVHVVPWSGVVVGPRVRATARERGGVRIVPRADPGTRVLSTSGQDGRGSSW